MRKTLLIAVILMVFILMAGNVSARVYFSFGFPLVIGPPPVFAAPPPAYYPYPYGYYGPGYYGYRA